MPPRSLTLFESPIADAVVKLGSLQKWEFAAYLSSPNGPLVEIRTLMRDDGADPSYDVWDLVKKNTPIVVHHNHLSQESLSHADWMGLTCGFDEIFAHCEDGTTYWGRVLACPCVIKRVLQKYTTIETCAENNLFAILNALNGPNAANLAHFFRKEVVNRAMGIRNFVEYEYSWGTHNIPPYVHVNAVPAHGSAGILGAGLNGYIDQAAQILAHTL